MAYTLNSIDLYNTYGIRAGHAPDSNIAIQGCFDLPARTGKCFHSWGDEDGIEPYVASGEMFYAGRDIVFTGSILGANSVINSNLTTFYTAINASGISVFETPYVSASGYVKSVTPEYMHGGAKITMTFREPIVSLTGTLPASGGTSSYTIDNIPFSSFGLYLSKAEALHDLPELKEQYFTRYGAEGYQVVKRKHNILDFNGFIIGTSLSDFQSKVSALRKLFSSSGTRTINLNNELTVVCFATEGFKVDRVYLFNNRAVANFRMSLLCESVTEITAGYCSEALALFARMTEQPSDTLKSFINEFIVSCVANGNWAKLKLFYYWALQDEQASLLCWNNATYNATNVNAVAHTPYDYMRGDGATNYLKTNFTIAWGTNLNHQNYSHGYYQETNDTDTDYNYGGGINVSIGFASATTTMFDVVTCSLPNANQLRMAQKVNSTLLKTYKSTDGSLTYVAEVDAATPGGINSDIQIFGRGAAGRMTPRAASCFFLAEGMSEADLTAFASDLFTLRANIRTLL